MESAASVVSGGHAAMSGGTDASSEHVTTPMLSAMSGYLQRLRRCKATERRHHLEEALLARLTTIDDQPLVASLLVRLRCDGFRVTHLTYDDPEFDGTGASMQFTYHLQDGAEGADLANRDEIRGSGMAMVDDDGVVHLSEVDGEFFQVRTDQEPMGQDL